ncbi:MAG: aminoacetone oxidase family FAD-binding enzyme [Lachnospiraceae bacterium]|nr:aminoacetone oxidase family FAD-binding enzyme [Lachnospiraceae bacterium]
MAKTVVIAGGGASGLMAALAAARKGASVTVLEKENRPGKKILASGGGRCNLTNTGDAAGVYGGHDPAFAGRVLSAFSVADTMAVFRDIGLQLTEHEGWVYPLSEQSESVLSLLTAACRRFGVKIKTGEDVRQIRKVKGVFIIETASWHYEAEAVILAGGTSAGAVTSSSDSLIALAASLGHHCYPLKPSLTFLKSDDPLCRRWGGVRCRGEAALLIDNKETAQARGQLQLIDGGISGIPVFQISRGAAEALEKGHRVRLRLSLLPDTAEEVLAERLALWTAERGIDDESLRLFLDGYFPDRLSAALRKELRDRGVSVLRARELEISGCGSLHQAQVASGGVDTGEIDPVSCASTRIQGLYICGEMLDIDGTCGGWNLQFAWSTGTLAGMAAGEYVCSD